MSLRLATLFERLPKFDPNGTSLRHSSLEVWFFLVNGTHRFVVLCPPPMSRLWEFGSAYFDPTNTKAFPDCEARRIFERIASGKFKGGKDAQLGYSGGKAKSSRKDGKKDKKKKY